MAPTLGVRGSRAGLLGALALAACVDGAAGTTDLHAQATIPAGDPAMPVPEDLEFGELLLPWSEALGDDAASEPDLEGVESLTLAGVTLATSSPGADLAFVTSAEFTVEADGVEPTRLAWVSDVPAGATSVALEVEPIDLMPFYAASDTLRIRVSAEGHEPEWEVELHATLTVEARVTTERGCQALLGG